MKQLICLLGFVCLVSLAQADTTDDPLGVYWSPERDGKIEFYEKDGKIYGRTIWSEQPGMLDTLNPDPSQRDRLLLGADCFLAFEKDGDEWKGEVYYGQDGKTYQCLIWLVDSGETLKVRGYIGLPILGQTVEFERIE